MSLRVTCPSCGCMGDVETFFADDDGKRLAAKFAELDPALGRAVLAYLRLFKPPRTALRTSRAERIVEELLALVATGTVCKDERTAVRRPASTLMWAAGIEQMLLQRDRLSLPLDGHGYLRAVVFGLAEQAEARAEQRVEEDRRAGRQRSTQATPGSPMHEARLYAARMLEFGVWDEVRRDAYLAEQAAKHGEAA